MSYTAPAAFNRRQSVDILDSIPTTHTFTGSVVWPSANLAIYLPVILPRAVVVRKLWVAIGTTGTGHLDIGIFGTDWVQIVASGATVKAAPPGLDEQVVDITDTTLQAGFYYIGLATDSGTDKYQNINKAAPIPAAFGLLTEASAYPLPVTATPVVNQTLAMIPLVGMLLEGTPT